MAWLVGILALIAYGIVYLAVKVNDMAIPESVRPIDKEGQGSIVPVRATDPLGIRNNNLGNLKDEPGKDFRGQIGVDKNGYCIFATKYDGARALGITLISYYTRHRLTNPAAIQARYIAERPIAEKQAYAEYVAKRLGITIATNIDLKKDLEDYAKAIIEYENDNDKSKIVPWTRWIDQETLQRAISDALAYKGIK